METLNGSPHIVIHGYYGAGNYGDDIILLSIIDSLYKSNPNIKITVLTRNVFPIPTGAHPFEVVSRFDFEKTLATLKKADLLICGGGGILQDYSGFNMNDHFKSRTLGLDYYSAPIEAAYLLGKPVMLYAIGAGPLFSETSQRYLKTVLNWVDVITVRDEPSKVILESISSHAKPIVTADPAFNYSNTGNYDLNLSMKKGRYVGICLRNWFFKKGEQANLIHTLSELADFLHQQYGYKIALFPFNKSETDLNLIRQVYQRMNKKEHAQLMDRLSMEQTVHLIQSLDFVIGMRLHSIILATANGIPALGISYDEKVKLHMKLVGLEDYSISLENINNVNLKSKVADLIKNAPEIKTQLNQQISLLKETEKKNASLAMDLLGRVKND